MDSGCGGSIAGASAAESAFCPAALAMMVDLSDSYLYASAQCAVSQGLAGTVDGGGVTCFARR